MDRAIIEQIAADLGEERRRLKAGQQKNLERSASLLLNAKTAKIPLTETAKLLRISRQTAYRLLEETALASQAPDKES